MQKYAKEIHYKALYKQFIESCDTFQIFGLDLTAQQVCH